MPIMKASSKVDFLAQTFGIREIISGGQTGADRAALDFAIEHNIPHGGWCPKGRKAEDGPIPDIYQLRETTSEHYAKRTKANIRDADATLIITWGAPTGGTALTLDTAINLKKPVFVCDLKRRTQTSPTRDWLQDTRPEILNIAGPREGTVPGCYQMARSYLARIFV